MKTIWIVVLLVLGLLIFLLGCMMGGGLVSMAVSIFGALLMFPAMVRLGNILFPDKKAQA